MSFIELLLISSMLFWIEFAIMLWHGYVIDFRRNRTIIGPVIASIVGTVNTLYVFYIEINIVVLFDGFIGIVLIRLLILLLMFSVLYLLAFQLDVWVYQYGEDYTYFPINPLLLIIVLNIFLYILL